MRVTCRPLGLVLRSECWRPGHCPLEARPRRESARGSIARIRSPGSEARRIPREFLEACGLRTALASYGKTWPGATVLAEIVALMSRRQRARVAAGTARKVLGEPAPCHTKPLCGDSRTLPVLESPPNARSCGRRTHEREHVRDRISCQPDTAAGKHGGENGIGGSGSAARRERITAPWRTRPLRGFPRFEVVPTLTLCWTHPTLSSSAPRQRSGSGPGPRLRDREYARSGCQVRASSTRGNGPREFS